MDEFDDRWEAIVRKMHEGFPPNDVDRLVYLARRTNLDPLAKQLYATKRRSNEGTKEAPQWVDKVAMECTIDGLRLVAQRTGEYQGQDDILWCAKNGKWVDVWLDLDNAPHAARATVHRAGFIKPLSRVALFESFAQKAGGGLSFQWRRMPEHMLGKVAEALALRAAFPQEMSGIYLSEELDQMENEPAPIPSKPKARTLADVKAAQAADEPDAGPPNGSRQPPEQDEDIFPKMLGELVTLGKQTSTDVDMIAWCKRWAATYRALPVRSENAKLANQAMRKAASNCGIDEQQIRDWLDAYSAKDVGGEAGA